MTRDQLLAEIREAISKIRDAQRIVDKFIDDQGDNTIKNECAATHINDCSVYLQDSFDCLRSAETDLEEEKDDAQIST